MKFEGVGKLVLIPKDEDNDCIIYGASLKKIDGKFYWSEWDDFMINDIHNDEGTYISAEKISWRPLNNCFGKGEIFQMNE